MERDRVVTFDAGTNADEGMDAERGETDARAQSSAHMRTESAASMLERDDVCHLTMSGREALEAYEKLGPLDGDVEMPRLGSTLAALLNFAAAFRVFKRFLITTESVIVSAVSVASTLFFILYEIDGHRLGVNVSWTFVSFAIIYPLTGSLDAAFRRREEALKQLSVFKTNVLTFYLGHRDWDWGENGRAKLPAKHVNEVRWMMVQLVCDVRNFLTAPEVARLVHLNTSRGKVAWEKGRKIQWAIAQRVRASFQKLSLTTEVLKYAGMPGNESARLRQFHKDAYMAWENLRFLKTYRTPMATRAFARVYILIHPIFWAPYYAYIVSEMLHDEAGGYTGEDVYEVPTYTKGLVMFYACCLSVITSLAMLGLFNVRYSLEDPFATKERLSESEGEYSHRYTRGQDQVLINKELRELVGELVVEFKDTFETSGGGIPADLYPLPSRSRLQTIELEVPEVLHTTQTSLRRRNPTKAVGDEEANASL
jgi:hypothetical protein